MDAIYIVDVLYVGIASICAGFVVYGGWLCGIDKFSTGEQARDRAGSALHTGT